MSLDLGPALKYGLRKVLGTTTAPDIDAGFSSTVDDMIVALDLIQPAGTIVATGRATSPNTTYWLMCDGAAVSRATYATLFTAIGTTYGAGNGTTTFNVPDLQGRVPVGSDGTAGRLSANDALGNSGGAETVTLTEAQLASHDHDLRVNPSISGGFVYEDGTTLSNKHLRFQGGDPGEFTTSSGGGQSHPNMPPYQIVNFMIKA